MKLFEQLFKEYDPDTRPVLNSSHPVQVTVSLVIQSIVEMVGTLIHTFLLATKYVS